MGELEVEFEASSTEIRERTFSNLRPYCLQLLHFTRNPRRKASFLMDMADFLRQCWSSTLHRSYSCFCWTRQYNVGLERRLISSGSFVPSDSPFGGYMISDSAAEGTLRCFEELLRKCRLGSVNQMAVVLKELISKAVLSLSEVSGFSCRGY